MNTKLPDEDFSEERSIYEHITYQNHLSRFILWIGSGCSYVIFSLNWPLGRFSHRVAMSVCLFVCTIAKHPLLEVKITSG